jgi:energy-converting hydrogenase Eha subunit A
MNWLILTSALIAAGTTLIHAFLGGRDVAAPLLRSEVSEEIRLTMYACWHMVTAALGLTAVALLLLGTATIQASVLALFLGILWVLFALVFLFVTLVVARPRGLFRFPQWTLLLSVGVFALLGSLHQP